MSLKFPLGWPDWTPGRGRKSAVKQKNASVCPATYVISLHPPPVAIPDDDPDDEGAWSRRPELPVIFVSGYTGDRLGKAVLEKPHVRFLQKPFRAERLTELAASLLENVTSP